ncbi:hypothetical protein M3Y94_00535500 [Aphelenchoides besseyi]|nr:hypothetical protein M3Y94_00535500 [Aphelenchoides besseyi]KAI6225817.1 hypothetical protein M3Y95_00737100 [Aphelenchoides besseyi]
MQSEKSNGTNSTSVLCRILVGHETQLLDEPTVEERTHRWKVSVSSPHGSPSFVDRSFIRKVTFHLHETFRTPKRTVKRPPFELEETAYGEFPLSIVIQFAGIDKKYPINYDITLSMQKTAQHKELDFWIEVRKAPKDFVALALKYGGRMKSSLSRPDSSASSSKSKKSDKDTKRKKHDVLDQVKEFSAAPAALLSPIGKLVSVSTTVTPPPSDGTNVDKDEVYWDKVNEITQSLFTPIRSEKHNIPLLHSLDGISKDFIQQFERPTPLVGFDSAFMSFQFEKSDFHSFFENQSSKSEPQMLRLLIHNEQSIDD